MSGGDDSISGDVSYKSRPVCGARQMKSRLLQINRQVNNPRDNAVMHGRQDCNSRLPIESGFTASIGRRAGLVLCQTVNRASLTAKAEPQEGSLVRNN